MVDHLLVDLFQSFLGEYRKHNEETGQISFDCPACSIDKDMPYGDGKGNLEINYHRGLFKCWACSDDNNMHGSIPKLIKRYGNTKLIKDYELIAPEFIVDESLIKKTKTLSLPEGFKLLSKTTSKDYKADDAKRYLYSRGINDKMIHSFNIGYTCIGKYFNRIIFPSYDINGNLNYFVGRWFSKEKNKLKYLNPDVEKTSIIFNEHKLNFDATIYLVEGVTDHLVVPNSIPLLGKTITDELIELLHDNCSAYVVILLDGDAINDAKKIYTKLNIGDLKNRVKIIFCPEEYDPSKIHEKLGKRGILKLLKTARVLNYNELI